MRTSGASVDTLVALCGLIHHALAVYVCGCTLSFLSSIQVFKMCAATEDPSKGI